METITKILKLSHDGYWNLVFKNWFHYCEQYALKSVVNSQEMETSIEDFQKLLANASLFNYWYKQYQKYEAEFLEEVQPFLVLKDPDSLKKLYEKNVWKVKYEYSKILIDKARKLTLNPQLN